MMKLKHKFVKLIPDKIEEGILYISIEYATAIHKCVCGCKKDVVTPLSPIDWQLTFDGETVSLYPSIGNWSFDCQSHYWITKNVIRQAPKWSDAKISKNREEELNSIKKYFSKNKKKD